MSTTGDILTLSTPFRMGMAGLVYDSTSEADERDFHGAEKCQLYDGLHENVRVGLSLSTFLAISTYENMATTLSSLEYFPDWMREVFDSRDVSTKTEALSVFKDLPTNAAITPEQINGCLEAATWKLPVDNKLDPWGYCGNGRLVQSYQTCASQALFSNRTVKELTGDNVHFMMFQTGRHALKCHRFSFGDSDLDSNPQAVGDRREIEPNFLVSLGLDLALADLLRASAIRLDKVQLILNQKGYWLESHAQLLFQHILNSLFVAVSSDSRVIDVTGMRDLNVIVEVCKEYLDAQNNPQPRLSRGVKYSSR